MNKLDRFMSCGWIVYVGGLLWILNGVLYVWYIW